MSNSLDEGDWVPQKIEADPFQINLYMAAE